MFRRLVTGLAAATTAILSACQDAPVSTVVYSTGQAGSFLDGAAARGPVLVETLNTPDLQGGQPIDLMVADLVRRSITQRAIETTVDPRQASVADFRIRFIFGPAADSDPHDLCSARPSSLPVQPISADLGTPRLEALGVVCYQDRLHVAVRGHVSAAASSRESRFSALLKQMVRQMFAPSVSGRA